VAWPFCFFKNSQATWSRGLFEKFQKKSSHLKEKYFEIAKIFGVLGHIFSFLLLKLPYLAKKI
jgi:hypothetical protein